LLYSAVLTHVCRLCYHIRATYSSAFCFSPPLPCQQAGHARPCSPPVVYLPSPQSVDLTEKFIPPLCWRDPSFFFFTLFLPPCDSDHTVFLGLSLWTFPSCRKRFTRVFFDTPSSILCTHLFCCSIYGPLSFSFMLSRYLLLDPFQIVQSVTSCHFFHGPTRWSAFPAGFAEENFFQRSPPPPNPFYGSWGRCHI